MCWSRVRALPPKDHAVLLKHIEVYLEMCEKLLLSQHMNLHTPKRHHQLPNFSFSQNSCGCVTPARIGWRWFDKLSLPDIGNATSDLPLPGLE